MFSQHLASPAVTTVKPPAAADRVISYLFADSGLGLPNRIRLNVAPWTPHLVPPPWAISPKGPCHADLTTSAITTSAVVAS